MTKAGEYGIFHAGLRVVLCAAERLSKGQQTTAASTPWQRARIGKSWLKSALILMGRQGKHPQAGIHIN